MIGNEFDMRLLELVSRRSPEQIVEQTDEAVRIGVLRTTAMAFARLQFSHGLIREALYDDLAANRRIEVHREIGAAIEDIFQGRSETAFGRARASLHRGGHGCEGN